MKISTLLLVILLFFITNTNAQNKVNEIKTKKEVHYITTTIDYPIIGIYLFEGKTEPSIQLNPDGTGVLQLHDLSKKTIVWGMECDQKGEPKFVEGFDSAAYTLWYKNAATSNENESWNGVEFSIHFEKKKMYIMGERIKEYVD